MQTNQVEGQVKVFGGKIDNIITQVAGLKEFFGLLDVLAKENRELLKRIGELELGAKKTKELEETKLELLGVQVELEARIKKLEANVASIQEEFEITDALLDECEAKAAERYEEGRQAGFTEAREKLLGILTLPESKAEPEQDLVDPKKEAEENSINPLFQDTPKKKRVTAADFGLPSSSKYFKGKVALYHPSFLETFDRLARSEQKKIKLNINKLLDYGPSVIRAHKTSRISSMTPDGAFICIVGQPFFTFWQREKIEFYEAGMNK